MSEDVREEIAAAKKIAAAATGRGAPTYERLLRIVQSVAALDGREVMMIELLAIVSHAKHTLGHATHTTRHDSSASASSEPTER